MINSILDGQDDITVYYSDGTAYARQKTDEEIQAWSENVCSISEHHKNQTHKERWNEVVASAFSQAGFLQIGKPTGDNLKLDDGKYRLDLLDPISLQGTASVLSFGAEKYSPDGWRAGIEYRRIYAALMRHMMAWWNGEDLDPETGLSHIHHAACNIMFLQNYIETGREELDNRPEVKDG